MPKDFDIKDFADGVYQIVRLVPPGRATSYGAIARALGRPNYSRLVGAIMKDCPGISQDLQAPIRHATGAYGSLSLKRSETLDEIPAVPAHRVVNSQGVLSGKHAFGSPTEMRERLESEGITVNGDRIANWKQVFWDPIEEL